MEKKIEANAISEFPVNEMKYSQSVDEIKQLIPYLKEEMKPCPSEEIYFNLIETIDYYGLKRIFKIKSKNEANNNEALNKFKDNLLTEISYLETFTVIPTVNSFEIEKKTNKGNQFKFPKIYDINGDEISIGNNEAILFLYDNLGDIASFINRNKNSNLIIFCISINMNFFETKKFLKNNGLLNNKIFKFCFTEISAKALNSATNLKVQNLPRIAIIGSNGIIKEDKSVKNVSSFDLQRDLINNIGKKEISNEEQMKIDKFIFMENDAKRKVVKSMNIYLKNKGLNDVHFYVKSKICIDKKGIKKTRCYPVFYGEAKEEGRKMVSNLISILNEQELFNDIQCKVKYSH
jgi:hypothetical protein